MILNKPVLRMSALNPLIFPAEDEAAFFESYCLSNRILMQGAMLLGSVLMYVFFIWDKIIDPAHGELGQFIRGLVAVPTLWICASLLFIPSLRGYIELITIFSATTANICLTYIYTQLVGGFDYGVVGIVLVILFSQSLLWVRFPYFVLFCILSWVSFDVGQYVSSNSKSGMLVVNNLCIATAVLLGVTAVFTREMQARSQLKVSRALRISQQRVEQLLNEMLIPDEGRRIRSRADSAGSDSGCMVISYRRADSDAIAGRIRDRLVYNFGPQAIFMDIDNIPFGFDFREHIMRNLENTDLLVAIVGPKWLGSEKDAPARIHDETDPVRIEIEAATRRGIPILPVLVGGASMPSPADLPLDLKSFAFRNALEVEAGRDFNHHIERLVRSIDTILADRGPPNSLGTPVTSYR